MLCFANVVQQMHSHERQLTLHSCLLREKTVIVVKVVQPLRNEKEFQHAANI
jgi:hypothetical protein